ncbi:hypothetical protein, partial [Burkholderia vietnamiensis]|uniref:hypothetical protein n=1 Tax=Burkholderia vietnamiensis TaxID=60552 RepID=UPI0026520D6C
MSAKTLGKPMTNAQQVTLMRFTEIGLKWVSGELSFDQVVSTLETVSKRPRGAVNFRGELLTSGIGTTETEEMAKPIIDDELWT